MSMDAGLRIVPDGRLKDGSVYCVGRNYVDHIKELPNLLGIPSELPTVPMIFLKSPGCIQRDTPTITLPCWSANVQHEVELAVQLGPDLAPIAAAVAIDLTARDTQADAKRQGLPWTLAKSFAGACPMGSEFTLRGVDLQDLELSVEVNGKVRQRASTSLQIFPVAQVVAYLKQHFPVQPGDWVLTGTPEGVGPLVPGDRVTATLQQPGGGDGGGGRVLSTASWTAVAGPEVDADAWRAAGGTGR
ncbi:hypothetical protein FOA52_008381 [Chlamydomonas sp. UWO 241]|nr:hypothetical protein FOA52_008381 [Chlamydomonas sp. UWO 241]